MVIHATHQKLRGKWLKILKGTPTEHEVRLFNAEIRAYQGQKKSTLELYPFLKSV